MQTSSSMRVVQMLGWISLEAGTKCVDRSCRAVAFFAETLLVATNLAFDVL